MTREEIKKLIEADIDLVCDLIIALENRNRQLENRLAKDSHNSSKPPSSDGLRKRKKTKSLRKKTGKKKGCRNALSNRPNYMIPQPTEILTSARMQTGFIIQPN